MDMQHLKAELEFDVLQKKVMGTVEESFVVLRKDVDSLFLDAIEMDFSSISLDGKKIEFQQKNSGVELYFEPSLEWDEQHSLQITYSATPRKGLYFVGWEDTSGNSRKQIWTQGQGIDNRHWLPMYDEMNDKLTSELIVHFDEGYKVLSNGEKISEKKAKNGKKIWHYKISKPHAPYLIMLGIGDYAIEKRKSNSGVVQNLYYYPDEPETVGPTYKHSVEMFDFFEKEFSVDFPWKSYSQLPVQDFMYGAMENTTATIFGDFYLVDSRSYLDRNYVRVNAHELVHQWFGDMITARSSTHAWLQEGFATHYDMVYQGIAFGKDHFDWVRRMYNILAVAESARNYKGIANSEAGYVRHYPKSALVLQMLKDVVGKEQFDSVIEYFLEKHAYKNVDSEDLLIAFHEKLGLSLDWFWEQWVYRGGEPSYEVRLQENSKTIDFHVKQVHERNDLVGLFKMPIVFELHFRDGSMLSQTVLIEEQHQSVQFKNTEGKKLAYALFDPDSRILKSVSFEKPVEMLMLQAESAKHMIDRYDAIVALRTAAIQPLIPLYQQMYEEETFHGIRSEILSQMIDAAVPEAGDLMVKAINDQDVEMRKAALNNSMGIPLDMEKEYVKLLTDSSYQVIEDALEILSFHFPRKRQKYLDITKNEQGNRSHNVRIKWLEIAFQNSSDSKYTEELIDFLSPNYEFMSRINAAEALRSINYLNEEGIAYLIDARMSFNNRLNGAAKATLDHFYAQQEYKQMIYNFSIGQEWDSRELERLREYLQP